jgi:hypothetical protein
MRFVNRCSWASNVMKQVQTAVHLHGAAQMVRSAMHNYAEGDWVGLAVNVTDASMNVFAGLQSCFTWETPLLWEFGSKPILYIRKGERVWARDDANPDGPLVLKVVEQVFAEVGRIWHLHAEGRVIRTTGEHPFWVYNKGWVPTWALEPADLLSTHDGRWVAVEEVFDTGEYETVYNLRIADCHTYFVGSEEWGFSVWAHNAACLPVDRDAQHGLSDHHDPMVAVAEDYLAGGRHPMMPKGVFPEVREGGDIPYEVRTNQGTLNPDNRDGPSLRTADDRILRPDVQVLGTDGLVYVVEVTRRLSNGGVDQLYHQNREAELQAVYGQYWGGYDHIDIAHR